MSDLFLYDDAAARTFEPFALTRPISELRAGALLLRERWEHALAMKAAAVLTSTHLRDFDEPWGVGAFAGGALPKGALVANSRCAVALERVGAGDVLRCDGRVAAVRLSRETDAEEFQRGRITLEQLAPKDARAVEIRGRWMNHVWDFIGQLSPMLNEDLPALAAKAASVDASPKVFAEDGAIIEPHVFFDTSAGPVLVRRGATVQAFTRIVGPCYIGAESLVCGDKISGSAIGEVCKVHGEVSATIFVGHANKGHDGFVGQSYIGRWVNLGAGTITSNLKNTYGSVQLWTPSGNTDTGLQFLGTMFGDHAKTGIQSSLTTGTVIGAGANIYGSKMPPKVVPPFAWGDDPPYSTYRIDKFLDVASKVMARRHVDLSPQQRRMLSAAFEQRWSVDGKR